MTRTHLDLFSGIGGFALAASWAGFETVQFCEIDPFCQQVLAKNFPGVAIHDDIRTLTADIVGQHIDLLTGGFPCQPFSVAGERRGAEDDRHLWPEMFRLINEVRPGWVLGENVAGFVPMALDDCLADLEGIGYKARAVVVPACAVGAWHRRDRVWIIAHAERGKCGERRDVDEIGRRSDEAKQVGMGSSGRTDPNANGTGWSEQWRTISVQSQLAPAECGSWWSTEPGVGRVASRIPNRVDRLRSLGNAIVPQVAYEIIRLMA